MSGEHESSVPTWIRRSLENESPEKRDQLERVWRLLGETGEHRPLDPTSDAAWLEIRDRVTAMNEPTHQRVEDPSGRGNEEPAHRMRDEPVRRARDRRAARAGSRRGFAAAAAAAAAAVVILAGIWWIRPVTITTPAGAQQTVRLPDGSTAELNSATSIRFARHNVPIPLEAFTSRRISLDGEAYFRVVPSARPFVVETADAEVEALGTEFNVYARRGPAEDGTIVTLASGSVRLTPRSGATSPLTLSEKGGSARISRTSEIIRLAPADSTRLDHVLAWRWSGFAVVNRPLEAVLDEVERRYAIEITPRRGVDLSDSMSAFYLRGAAPEQILRDVCLVHACTYRETSRGFALSARDTTTGSAAPGSSADRMSRPE